MKNGELQVLAYQDHEYFSDSMALYLKKSKSVWRIERVLPFFEMALPKNCLEYETANKKWLLNEYCDNNSVNIDIIYEILLQGFGKTKEHYQSISVNGGKNPTRCVNSLTLAQDAIPN